MAEPIAIAAPAQQVLPPAAEPMPLPVERSRVLAAAQKLAAVQTELMRYLVHGPMSSGFAFEDEVVGALSEALRLMLEVEAHRADAAEEGTAWVLCTLSEREALGQMQTAITRFQEEWGRG